MGFTVGKRKGKIPKQYKWKARIKGHATWNYFTNKERAKRWVTKYGGGNVRKR